MSDREPGDPKPKDTLVDASEGADSRRVTLRDLADEQQRPKGPALTSTFDAELGSRIGMTLLAMGAQPEGKKISAIVGIMEKSANDGETDEVLKDSAARTAIATSMVQDNLLLGAAIEQYMESISKAAAEAEAADSADTIAQAVSPFQLEVRRVIVEERRDPETATLLVKQRIAAGLLDIKEDE